MKLRCRFVGGVIIHRVTVVYWVMLSMTRRGQYCLGVHINVHPQVTFLHSQKHQRGINLLSWIENVRFGLPGSIRVLLPQSLGFQMFCPQQLGSEVLSPRQSQATQCRTAVRTTAEFSGQSYWPTKRHNTRSITVKFIACCLFEIFVSILSRQQNANEFTECLASFCMWGVSNAVEVSVLP